MIKNKEKIQISLHSRNYNNSYQNITSFLSNYKTKHTDKTTDKNYEQISKEVLYGNDKHFTMNKFGFMSSYERSKRKPINVNIIKNTNKTNHYKAIIKTNNNNYYHKHIKMIIPKSEPKIKKTKQQIKIKNIKSKSNSFYNKSTSQKIITTLNNKSFKIINPISQNYKKNVKINEKKLKTATNSKSNFLIDKIRNHIKKLDNKSPINTKKQNISSNNIQSNKNIKSTKNRSIISKITNNKQYFNTSKIKRKQISKIIRNYENLTKTHKNKISDISNSQLKDDDSELKTFKIISTKHINSHKSCCNLSKISNKNIITNLKIKTNSLKNNCKANCKSQETQETQKIEFVEKEIESKYIPINDSDQENSEDNTNENLRKIPNENGFINKNYNLKLHLDKNLFSEAKKTFIEHDNNEQLKNINKLINRNISWDLSSRNETNGTLKINNIPYKKEFKFITDIEKTTNKIILIKISNILKLKNSSLFHLLSFIYEYYSILIKANNVLAKKIISSLTYIFSPVIQQFEEKYSTFLEIKDFYFQDSNLIVNKKSCHAFNLVITSKIITHEVNKSFEISCDFESSNKNCDYFWKFDILNRRKIKVWYNTEIFNVNRFLKRFTFSSQVSSFSYSDEIKLVFNIFNEENIIKPKTITWMKPKIININEKNFTQTLRNKRINDPLRICEIEDQILIWREYLEEKPILIQEFVNIFQKYFKINDILYDKTKINFYKIEMIAAKKGKFSKNKFLSFDINIISYDDNLQNELQCIYLMNSNPYFNKTDIRIGTQVTFYITDYQ